MSAIEGIVLQNSKVAAVQIFGENLKRKEVDDSHGFSCATEVAHEFGARRRGPSDHYTKNAPAAPRIFDTSCKATFATQSALSGCRTSALLGLLLWGYCCKSLFGGTNAISADASYERRREGPYRFIQNRPGTSIGALKSDPAAEKPKDQLSRDFSGRSIFDFCNNIVGKADMGKVCRLTDHFQLACLNLIMA